MKIDFSKVSFDENGQAERPTIVLCNPNMAEVACIANAEQVQCKLCFNDQSSFEFVVPQWEDCYDKIKGKKLIRIDPYGYFRLERPKEIEEGAERYKECTAYSLEKELEDKKISDSEGAFKFFEPTFPEKTDTIMGMIHAKAPSWTIGEVDSDLYNLTRYFDITNQNLYNWMMQDVQKTYSCVFIFDTYNRRINVKAVKNLGTHSTVYLSKDNVISNMEMEELSEETITCLEVYGADADVNIMSVNPRGDNYIYNYDYFMTEEWFPGEEKIKIVYGDTGKAVFGLDGKETELDETEIYFAKSLSCGTDNFELQYIRFEDGKWISTSVPNSQKGFINRWYDYKTDFKLYQDQYSNYINIQSIYNSKINTLNTELIDLENLLLVEEQALEACIESGQDSIKDENYAKHYYNIYGGNGGQNYQQQIEDKQSEIDEVRNTLELIEGQLVNIKVKLQFDKYFTTEQIKMLDNITFVDTLKENSFAYSDSDFSGSADVSGSITISDDETDKSELIVEYTESQEVSVNEGPVAISDMTYIKVTDTVLKLYSPDRSIRITFDEGVLSFSTKDDKKFDFSGSFIEGRISDYDGEYERISGDIAGTIINDAGEQVELDTEKTYWAVNVVYGDETFRSVKIHYDSTNGEWTTVYTETKDGTVSFSGVYSEIAETEGKKVFALESGTIFMTRAATANDRINVSNRLFEYAANEIFPSISVPSYEFEVDADNFIFLQEFEEFRRTMEFGDCICLERPDGEIIYPLLLEVEMDFDDRSKFEITFSNKLKVGDAEYDLEQLFEDAFAGSRNNSYERSNYVSFTKSGAKTELYDFINSALDASKNKIINSSEQSFVMDSTGLRGRRKNENGAYEDEQVWMSNNQIVFTNDGWQSAKCALGKVSYGNDEGQSLYGIVADAVVGKLIAGRQLSIESEAVTGGGYAQFKVDGSGVSITNASLVVSRGETDIVLNSTCGIGMGSNLYSYDSNGNMILNYDETWERWTSSADVKFMLDKDGNAYFKGEIDATDGTFNGTVRAKDLFLGENETSVLERIEPLEALEEEVQECFFNLKGLRVVNNTNGDTTFKITNDGSVYISGDIHMQSGSINWDNTTTPVKVLYSRVEVTQPDAGYSTYPENSTTGWHREYSNGDVYVSYSYNGGTVWSAPIRFVGKDGQDGINGADGSDANVPSYIKETYIDQVYIASPIINGGIISSQTSINVGTDAVVGKSVFLGAGDGVYESDSVFSNGVFWGGATLENISAPDGNTYSTYTKGSILAGMQLYNGEGPTIEVGDTQAFYGPAFILSGVEALYINESTTEMSIGSGGSLKRVLTTDDKLSTHYVFA